MRWHSLSLVQPTRSWKTSRSRVWLEICDDRASSRRQYGVAPLHEPFSKDRRVARDDRPRAGGYRCKQNVGNMISALQSELTINVVASIIVSLLFLGLGFLWGKYKERRRKFGRNLEEYDFYPFTVTRENFGEFSL